MFEVLSYSHPSLQSLQLSIWQHYALGICVYSLFFVGPDAAINLLAIYAQLDQPPAQPSGESHQQCNYQLDVQAPQRDSQATPSPLQYF